MVAPIALETLGSTKLFKNIELVRKKYRTTNEAAAPPAMNGQRRAGRTVSEDMFKFGGDLVSGFAFGGDKTQPTISSYSAPKGTRRTFRRKPWLDPFWGRSCVATETACQMNVTRSVVALKRAERLMMPPRCESKVSRSLNCWW